MDDHEKSISFEHNGRSWKAVCLDPNWFAEDDRVQLTGPWRTAEAAMAWVRDIRP